ncbi:MAG: hypothetical protein CMI23_01345 [Opitutae bacterium]|nr:hypothetical protein [Opitutae bacterium]|tara:strand:- start:1003 stop:1419 length:417 start_codon:yes stop_codon:yes gene_type:complete
MTEKKFPDLPDPTEIPKPRMFSSVVYWWIGTILLLGFTIIWLPSQCTSNEISGYNQDENSIESLPQVNQNQDLEFREDGLWYQIGKDVPFNGAAVDFHENGVMKSRTKIVEGTAVGLIEEWDENGTIRGVRFKDEFPQ